MSSAPSWGLLILLGIALVVVLRHLLGMERGEREPQPQGTVAVYAAGTLYEARLVLDLLDEAGIRAVLLNENVSGLAGALPETATRPTLWLEDAADWDRARAVVRDYEKRRTAELGAEVLCPACLEKNPGNFELCWHCHAPLTGAQAPR